MNEEDILFLYGILILIIPVLLPFLFAKQKYVHIITSHNATDNSIFDESKKILQSIGYSATEAKQMLKKTGPCNNIDEWVQKVLKSNET